MDGALPSTLCTNEPRKKDSHALNPFFEKKPSVQKIAPEVSIGENRSGKMRKYLNQRKILETPLTMIKALLGEGLMNEMNGSPAR